MGEFLELRKLSAAVGADSLLVQGAGGNTSIKQDGTMWIKASGTWLRDASSKDIFVPLELSALKTALAVQDADCESCVKFVRSALNEAGLRPSIETSVHGLMPQKIVLHVHCVNTIAWAIQENAEALIAEKLMGESWVYIPYARPGLNLAKAIRQRFRPNTNILVLGNHGLVVAAETVAKAEALLRRIVEKLQRPIRSISHVNMADVLEISKGTAYVPAAIPKIHSLALDAFALNVGTQQVFYPDHVVFLGTKIARDFSENPPVVVVPKKGVLVRKDAKPAVPEMLACLANVFARISETETLKPLSGSEIDQLLNWDAEKYRQTLPTP